MTQFPCNLTEGINHKKVVVRCGRMSFFKVYRHNRITYKCQKECKFFGPSTFFPKFL